MVEGTNLAEILWKSCGKLANLAENLAEKNLAENLAEMVEGTNLFKKGLIGGNIAFGMG